MGRPREELEFLVRSDCRVGILELLSERGPATRRELQRNLDVVRTTIQRNLDGLEDRNLIYGTDDGYDITPAGELVSAVLLETIESMAFAIEAGPLLGRLAASSLEFDLDPRTLTDATVVEATVCDPYAPVERYESAVGNATTARLLLPPTATNPLAATTAAIETGEVHEVIVPETVVQSLERESQLQETLAATGDVDVYRYDGEISCYLGVLDDLVQIGVPDRKGIPEVLLESTREAVREWAIEQYDRYRERAERIV